MKQDLQLEVELTDGVTASLDGTVLKIKGPKGEVERNFAHPRVKVTIEGNQVILKAAKATKREKTILGSYTAHIKNMTKGVVEPFQYKVKICSGHFPMNVAMSGQELIVKNFLGEAVPRRVMLPQGTKVQVNGTEIDISSPNKELAGQAASKIENLCRITNRDRRIFQDGIYITQKPK